MKRLKSLGKTIFDVSPAAAFVHNTGDTARTPFEISSSRSSSGRSRVQSLKSDLARTVSYSEDSASDIFDDSRKTISPSGSSVTSTSDNYNSEMWMKFFVSDEGQRAQTQMGRLKSLGKTIFDVSPATAFVENTGDTARTPYEVSSSRSSSGRSRVQSSKNDLDKPVSYSEDSASDIFDDSRRTISPRGSSVTSTLDNYNSERWMKFFISDEGQVVELQEPPRPRVHFPKVFDDEESSVISSRISNYEEGSAISPRVSDDEESSAISPRVSDDEESSAISPRVSDDEESSAISPRVSDQEESSASTENDVILEGRRFSLSEDVSDKVVSFERVEAEKLQAHSEWSSQDFGGQDTRQKNKDMSIIEYGVPADPELTEMRHQVQRKYREVEEKFMKMLPSRKIDFSSRSWGRRAQASQKLQGVQI